MDITYDPAVVSVADCEPEEGGVCNAAYTADSVRITGASASGVEGETVLGTITFECGDAEDTSALTLAVSVFADSTPGDPTDITETASNGSVECAVAPPTNTPTTPAKACGDVNDDGQVNSVDASLILQLKAGLISSLVNEESGDVNGDGNLTSVDAALILQLDAGLIPSLSC